MRGVWAENEGRVAWRTGGSWGSAGFRVVRIDPLSGEETILNEVLLPVAFHDPAATYAVVDPEAVEGGAGRYRLEETTMAGGTNDLGTYEVAFAPPPKAARTAPPAKTALPKTTGPADALKVRVREEGIYGVAIDAIAAGLGIGVADAQARAAAGALGLTLQGRPVPAIYDAARGRLVFHGRPSTNWYARDNAYLIRGGAGAVLPRRAPGATAGVATLPAQARFEQDVFPFNGAVQRPDDFYYWNFVISSTDPATNRVDFPFVLDGYGGGAWTLKVDVQGWSKTTTRNPDHRAEYFLNGTLVGTNAFDDQLAATATLAIPPGVASAGANVLTVRGVLTNASQYSYFVVDGFTAEYERDLVPGAGTAFVRAGGAASVSAAAYAEPLVFALDEAGEPIWIADETGALPDKAWAAAATNERFAVIEAESIRLLAPEPAAAAAWFLAETNRIDYLVLTSRALAPAAQELADYRAGQGLRVGVAVFEDVCDLLAGGLRTPEAIPALVRHAAATWAESPRMLVLAGNGHYDFLESMGTEANHLPPLLRQTYDGLFSSDELMADAGGDELPDVAVGRLPACTAEELAAMIAKIKAYEADFGAEWQNQGVFANDQADAAGDFAASIARFTNLVQNPYSVSARADLDVQAIAPARAAFLGGFSNGAGVVHYTGHGTSVKLSAQGLLTAADVGALTNARTPFVAMLCCLAGHFDAPAVNSLGEGLMQRVGGGAVSVWASSALPLNAPATDLGEAFYRKVLQERKGPLGRALLETRRSLPGDLFTKNTFATYNLLGDPALRIFGNDPATVPATAAQVFLGNLSQSCDFTPRAATATTLPAGLAVKFTYAGSPTPPTLPGIYAVTASVATAYYAGSATGTLTIAKVPAAVALGNLAQIYDGTPKSATATTDPADLDVRFTYSGATNPPTAAGNYWVVATVDDPTWQGGASGVLAVAKAPAAVALQGLAQVYDGSPRVVTATTAPAGLPVGLTYNGSANAPTGAGSYVVTAKVVSASYVGAATGTLVVAKAAASVTLNGLDQTYDGTPRVVTASTVPDELAVDVRYDGVFGAPTAAGTYAVSGTVSDPNWQGAATGALVVAPAAQTIDFPPIADQWTSNIVALAATASSGLPVSFAVAAGPGVILDGTLLSFTGAGSVEIVASQAGGGNWAAAPPVSRTVAVAYALPIPEISAWDVQVREAGEGRLHVRLPGKGSAVVSVARIAGSTNLTVRSGATLTFKVTNWDVFQTVTLAAANDDNAESETATFRISSPGLSDLLVTATTLDDEIGLNLALAAGGATISGSQAANAGLAIDGVHTSAAAVATAVWTSTPPGSLTLDLQTTSVLSRVRILNPDWTVAAQRYRLEGSRDGTNWTLLADAGAEARRGWDEWAVSGVARFLRFTALSNSASASAGLAEWEVYGTPWTKEPAIVVLDDLEQVYDGAPKQPRATTVPAGLAVDFTYDGSPIAPSAAGTYAVVGTVRDEIYQGSATGTLTILSATNLFEEWLQDDFSRALEDPAYGPDDDADGDGATTWEEFLADTDPADPGEVFALQGEFIAAAQAGGDTGEIRFTFPASPNRYYQLETCTDLVSGAREVVDLGWGVPGMTVTNRSPGAWYATIRVLLQAP
ncbi:MAG: MBG domain-containing protein [Kiritimatiellia bacterium]